MEKRNIEARRKIKEIEKNGKRLYQKMIRPPGNGTMRIGTTMELREDIYCISFLCQLKPEIIMRFIHLDTSETIYEREDRL
jgi:hypothetical protein